MFSAFINCESPKITPPKIFTAKAFSLDYGLTVRAHMEVLCTPDTLGLRFILVNIDILL